MDIPIKGLGDVPEMDKITYDHYYYSWIRIHKVQLRLYHDDMIYLLRVGEREYGLYYWQYADTFDDFNDYGEDD